MSRLRRYEPFLDWDGHEVESEQASMREHENGAWTDYFMALSIEAERDALKARVAELLESDHKVIEALTAKVASLSSHETCACSVDTPEDVCMHHSPEVMRLRARVTELEAYLAGWVKISERNPPVPGVYKVMVIRPIYGGSFVCYARWEGHLWESLNVGPIDYQIVAWYDNGLEI